MNNHDEMSRLLAVYKDLNPSQRALVDAHIATCTDCAKRLSAYRMMDNQLRQLPRLQPDVNLRQNFHAALETIMTQHTKKGQLRRLPAFAIQLVLIGAIILLGASFWISLREQKVPASAPAAALPTSRPADINPYFEIEDVTFEQQNYQPGDSLSVRVFWKEAVVTGNETLALHLMDESGQLVAQVDTALLENTQSHIETTYDLMLPDDIENGRYLLQLIIYNQETGQRLSTKIKGSVTESIIASKPVYVGETPVMPIWDTAVIRLESWSPDSQYLMFREYSETEYINGDVGAQRVYDVAADEFCPHAIDVRPGNVENWLAWMNDHTFAYISAGGSLALRQACDLSTTLVTRQTPGEIVAILGQSHDLNMLLMHTTEHYLLANPVNSSITLIDGLPIEQIIVDAKFSPDDKLVALVDNVGTIWFVDTGNGEVIRTIPWQLEGQLPDTIWLTNDLLLARALWLPQEHALMTLLSNPDLEAQSGAFVVGTGGSITSVESLFNTPITATQRILAAPDLEQGSYAILLYNDPERGESAPIRLYHAATGELETLPYSDIWDEGITKDGRYLLIAEEINGSGQPGYNFLVREVTAVGEEPRLFLSTAALLYPDWSPTYQQIAFKNLGDPLLQIVSFPASNELNFWHDELQYAVIEDVLWSPDQKYLAASGGMSGVMKSGLFILETSGYQIVE